MTSINEKGVVAKLLAVKLMTSLQAFLEPVLGQLPVVQLQEVAMLAVRGILAGQSPIIAEMARGGKPKSASNWPLAKRFYRFVANQRFDHRDLLKGLYGVAYHWPKRCLGQWYATRGRNWWWRSILSTSRSRTRSI